MATTFRAFCVGPYPTLRDSVWTLVGMMLLHPLELVKTVKLGMQMKRAGATVRWFEIQKFHSPLSYEYDE